MNALIKKRSTVKAKLTRASNSSNQYLSCTTSLKLWLGNIEKIENEFDDVQAKIEELEAASVDGEVDQQEIERANFEQSLFELKLKLRRALNNLTPTVSIPTNQQHAAPRVKLQNIELPTFSGDWKEWPSFYQLFTKLVHEDPAYSTVEKFYQLSTHLSGEAAAYLERIDIVEANYNDALELLKKRYDNPRLIVNNYMKMLFELPTANNDSQLRPLVDTLQKTLRALSTQLEPSEYFDIMVVYLIGTRLSQGIRRQWEITLENSRQLPKLDKFVTFLEQRAMSAEVLSATSITTDKRTNVAGTSSTKASDANSKGKRNVLFSHIVTQNNACPICNELHYVFQCKRYTKSSIADRENLVNKHRLCGNCLHPRHTTASCRSSKCKRCGNLHHTSLHKETSSSAAPLNDAAPVFSGLAAQPQTSTILPTAYVHATNHEQTASVRMVIDSASQCTVITENLARRLKLTPTPAAVNMEGIGGSNPTAPQLEANLTIRSHNSPYELEINAKILPVITNYRPKISGTIVELLKKPGLPLADNFDDDSPIDILLGAEYWSTIMQPGKLEIKPTLSPLLNSSFGWLAAGILPAEVSVDAQ